MRHVRPTDPEQPAAHGAIRRAFIGYVMAGATLATAADMALGSESAEAAVPTPPCNAFHL